MNWSASQAHAIAVYQAPSNPFAWYAAVLRKYAVFQGRASRAEYWSFYFINLVAGFVLSAAADRSEGFLVLYVLLALGTLVPQLAALTRRLHDTGRSGWNFFYVLIPFVGAIILLVMLCKDSQAGANAYGVNPKTG